MDPVCTACYCPCNGMSFVFYYINLTSVSSLQSSGINAELKVKGNKDLY